MLCEFIVGCDFGFYAWMQFAGYIATLVAFLIIPFKLMMYLPLIPSKRLKFCILYLIVFVWTLSIMTLFRTLTFIELDTPVDKRVVYKVMSIYSLIMGAVSMGSLVVAYKGKKYLQAMTEEVQGYTRELNKLRMAEAVKSMQDTPHVEVDDD